ncbi:MAG: hypothetical protein JXB36_01170 [Gammaproteobacteria bacterium]|nr:hypothetical protein [Gammaproteobacteria bacterium]
MADPLRCYRCGASLAELSLPLSRLDECPACRAELHVCRMCTHYSPRLAEGCDEDDAPDVRDRAAANFCDYFRPDPHAYDSSAADPDAAARAQLEALFGDAPADGAEQAGPQEHDDSNDAARRAAEALFRK